MKEIENEGPETYMSMIEGLRGRKERYILSNFARSSYRRESSKSFKLDAQCPTFVANVTY